VLKGVVIPTYEYICEACGHEFDHFQQITAKRLTKCPKCDKLSLRRKIGRGGGIIFKGEPFSSSTEYLSKNKKRKK